jgi:hypothetical protein
MQYIYIYSNDNLNIIKDLGEERMELQEIHDLLSVSSNNTLLYSFKDNEIFCIVW